jgi:hypothetical protein
VSWSQLAAFLKSFHCRGVVSQQKQSWHCSWYPLPATLDFAATQQEEEEGPASPWYATSTDTDLDSMLGSIPEEGESRLQSGAPPRSTFPWTPRAHGLTARTLAL